MFVCLPVLRICGDLGLFWGVEVARLLDRCCGDLPHFHTMEVDGLTLRQTMFRIPNGGIVCFHVCWREDSFLSRDWFGLEPTLINQVTHL